MDILQCVANLPLRISLFVDIYSVSQIFFIPLRFSEAFPNGWEF